MRDIPEVICISTNWTIERGLVVARRKLCDASESEAGCGESTSTHVHGLTRLGTRQGLEQIRHINSRSANCLPIRVLKNHISQFLGLVFLFFAATDRDAQSGFAMALAEQRRKEPCIVAVAAAAAEGTFLACGLAVAWVRD